MCSSLRSSQHAALQAACQHAPALKASACQHAPPLRASLVSTLRHSASLSAFSYVPCAPGFVTSGLTGRREVSHGSPLRGAGGGFLGEPRSARGSRRKKLTLA